MESRGVEYSTTATKAKEARFDGKSRTTSWNQLIVSWKS